MEFAEPTPEIMKMLERICFHNSCRTCVIEHLCKSYCRGKDLSEFNDTIRKIYYESYCENSAENVSVSEKEIMSLFGAAYG